MSVLLSVVTVAAVVLVAIRLAPAPASRSIRCEPPLTRTARSRWPVAPGHLLAIAAAIGGGATIGPFPVLVAVIAAFVAPRLRRARSRRRTQRAIDAALPDSIELLVLLLHAGSTPIHAIRELVGFAPAPLAPAFRAVSHRLDRGQRLADALGELPVHLGPGARPMADGIAAADRYGLPLGPVLDRLAAEIRTTRRRVADAEARTMSVRMAFPLVTCTLPAFVLLAIVPAVVGAAASIRGLGP